MTGAIKPLQGEMFRERWLPESPSYARPSLWGARLVYYMRAIVPSLKNLSLPKYDQFFKGE